MNVDPEKVAVLFKHILKLTCDGFFVTVGPGVVGSKNISLTLEKEELKVEVLIDLELGMFNRDPIDSFEYALDRLAWEINNELKVMKGE